MERAGVELKADDGEDEDGEHDEQRDLHQRRQRLEDRLQHHLQAWCGNSQDSFRLQPGTKRRLGTAMRGSKWSHSVGHRRCVTVGVSDFCCLNLCLIVTMKDEAQLEAAR